MAQDSNGSLGFVEFEDYRGPSEPIGRIPQNASCGNCKTECMEMRGKGRVCILWEDKESDSIEKRGW